MTSTLIKGAALVACLFLAACEDPAERAERYYQSALTLLAEGDVERAIVEFRNVFEHDGFHKEARMAYAQTLLGKGDETGAYGQYLRLIEQYPDTADVRLTLAEIALTRADWREVIRHGSEGVKLSDDTPRAAAIDAAIAYHIAVEDGADLTRATRDAQTVLARDPNNLVALRIAMDAAVRGPLLETALPYVEHALTLSPDTLEFHTLKLRLLTESGDDAAAVTQLEAMFDRFPDNTQVRTALVNWYLSQEDYTAAEAVLRDLAGDPETDSAGHVTLVQFLRGAYGDANARTELATLADQTDGTPAADLYRALHAVITFEGDDENAGLSAMTALTATLPDSDQSRRIRAMHAKMLISAGDVTGARTVVDGILAQDTAHVPALKMLAAWHIADDKSDAAITSLRTALSQAPRDPEIMLLMATAHERSGFPELAGERLALAVEVSGAGVTESLRYAQFLIRDNRMQAAEAVLRDARGTHPRNLEVISRLADLRLRQKDWPRATGLLNDLRALTGPRAASLATALEAAILSGQNRADESLNVLTQQLPGLDEDSRAAVTIAMAQIRLDKLDEARDYLASVIAKRPDDETLKLLSGSVAMMQGDADSAEEIFRAVLDKTPDTEAAVRLLYSLLHLQDRKGEANTVLDAGLAQLPTSQTLLWIKAGALELAGDIDGAIAIYEGLYADDSSSVVVANNLASLLASHRDDTASLDRAERIARRLRGLDIPAFQDTYGWILARKGDHATAIEYLKAAAAGLPQDGLVSYHLGVTYLALDQKEAAITALTHALDVAPDSTLPQFADARTTLTELLAQP